MTSGGTIGALELELHTSSPIAGAPVEIHAHAEFEASPATSALFAFVVRQVLDAGEPGEREVVVDEATSGGDEFTFTPLAAGAYRAYVTLTVTSPRGTTSRSATPLFIAVGGGGPCPALVFEYFAFPFAQIDEEYEAHVEFDGGFPPVTFALVAGALPPGMEIDGDHITGIPTAAGTFDFDIEATDSCPEGAQVVRRNLNLSVRPPAGGCPVLAIQVDAVPEGLFDVPYFYQLVALGGEGTVTFALIEGTLPAGLELDPALGIINGIPEESGSFAIRVQATDACDPVQTATRSLVVVVG